MAYFAFHKYKNVGVDYVLCFVHFFFKSEHRESSEWGAVPVNGTW